jgi:hypothetical protein
VPTNNGLTLANKAADIEIENAAGDIYGFPLLGPTLPEDRASQLTASHRRSGPDLSEAPSLLKRWSGPTGLTATAR